MFGWLQTLLDRLMAALGYYRPDDEEDEVEASMAAIMATRLREHRDAETLPPPPAMIAAMALGRAEFDPSQIPDDAQFAKWEAKHLFPAFGKRPERHAWGLECGEPPLALVCPDCDYRQPPLRAGQHRRCRYCGVHIAAHGTLIYWWRRPAKVLLPKWLQAKEGGL